MEDTKTVYVAFYILLLDILRCCLSSFLDKASYLIVTCFPSFGENASFHLWLNHYVIPLYHYLFLFSQIESCIHT